MFLLGESLRLRFSSLIPPLYMPEHVYVLSSDADRCIMSAEVFLAALYPPLPFQKIHPQLDWQPIPVHTVPLEHDRVKISSRLLIIHFQYKDKLIFRL